MRSRTQVGIVGAGPAGLLLGHLLAQRGIDAVVLENRTRDYVEARIRAGLLESGTVETLRAAGVGDRLDREGLVHEGTELRFYGDRFRVPYGELTGKTMTIYGQQEVVKDLIAARVEAGLPLLFEAGDVALEGLDTEAPVIRYRHQGEEHELVCDVVAGCDGYHGVARASIPDGVLTTFERDYPFGWLGIIAEVAPSSEELVYALSDRGFALHSARSPTLSRLYVQCDPSDDLAEWPDSRIWSELHARLATPGWELEEGPVVEKSIAAMRSFVVEPMQWGRLFLAGDAAHIVPPTGAKGMNLAIADVRVLTDALTAFFDDGDERALASYSRTALKRVWRAQEFSASTTAMLHRYDGGDDFQRRVQRSQFDLLRSSEAAARTFAENYVGTVQVDG